MDKRSGNSISLNYLLIYISESLYTLITQKLS